MSKETNVIIDYKLQGGATMQQDNRLAKITLIKGKSKIGQYHQYNLSYQRRQTSKSKWEEVHCHDLLTEDVAYGRAIIFVVQQIYWS